MTTDKTIEEMNRAIAEFEGWKQYNDGEWYHPIRQRKVKLGHTPRVFKYHSSWNALMPVVRKIATDIIHKDWNNLKEALARWKPICNELEKCDLANVHFCVYKFIEWYTTTKQKD